MKNIYIYVGENICDLKFSCGGAPVGFNAGKVTYWCPSTHRHLIEGNLHPRKVAEKVKWEVDCCKEYYDLHFSTNSDVPVNLIGYMIRKGTVPAENVKVYVLSEDNKEILFESSFDPEGYLVNWPYGFMDWDYSILD